MGWTFRTFARVQKNVDQALDTVNALCESLPIPHWLLPCIEIHKFVIRFRGYLYALYEPAKKREAVWETSPSLFVR